MGKEDRTIASTAKHAALSMLGRKLRDTRRQAGLTQREVGAHLGVTGQTVRNWETGRNEPSKESLDSLASLFNIHPEELKTESRTLSSQAHLNGSRQRIQVDPLTLIQARKDAGLSQETASSRSGINITSIRRYERGNAKPTRGALQRLALIYNKPPLWLDPESPNGARLLQPEHLDPALRVYLDLQPELTGASIREIGKFILATHQNQLMTDR